MGKTQLFEFVGTEGQTRNILRRHLLLGTFVGARGVCVGPDRWRVLLKVKM